MSAVLPVRLPLHGRGMTIGLYGGSFDPPHAGHRLVALTALRRLGLDRVWWIVTPANPLKTRRPRDGKHDRLAATRAVARHPRMEVADVETGRGFAYTVDTIRMIRRRCPGVRFVWIMGADSLAGFHRWRDWRELADLVPLAAVDRPGWTLTATRCRAAVAFADRRVPEQAARALPYCRPPAWCLLHGPRSDLSSTSIRDNSRLSDRPH